MTLLLSLMLFNVLLALVVALKYSYDTLTILESAAAILLLLGTTAFLGFTWLRKRGGAVPAGATLSSGLPSSATWVRSPEAAIRFGLLVGLLWAVEIGINNFLTPPLPARDRIDNLFWAAIAVLILAGSLVVAYRLGRFQAGVIFGFWSGLASGAVACGMALAVTVFGLKFLLQDPLNLAEWAARSTGEKAHSMAAYFAFQTLAGALLHLVVLGAGMGLLLGVLGGGLGRGLRAFLGK
jgi:hypothetical protein